jgi:aryl-alcohol dehydrogenase-like predicted oxidoreductase
MMTRRYGEHDVFLSVVGFGGICVMDESPEDAARIVSRAVDRGINYFDVAPSYGNAEERLGPALEPYRRDVFLACKTNIRDADGAEREFHQSLRRLRTDHIDLYQLHAIETEDEVDRILAPGGALEVLTRLRDAGDVRFLGFSAHNEDAAMRLLDAFAFDSVLFPVNWRTWHAGGVGPRLVDRARSRGAAVLALKALADRRREPDEAATYPKAWYEPVGTYAEAEMGLRFTLSRPVTAAVSPGHEELLWWACDAAAAFSPLSDAEEREIRDRALAPPADAGRPATPVFTRSITGI